MNATNTGDGLLGLKFTSISHELLLCKIDLHPLLDEKKGDYVKDIWFYLKRWLIKAFPDFPFH